jgi:hypothetical protein
MMIHEIVSSLLDGNKSDTDKLNAIFNFISLSRT